MINPSEIVIDRPDPRPWGWRRGPRKGKYVPRTRLYKDPPTFLLFCTNWREPEGRYDALYSKKKFKAPTEPKRPTYEPMLCYTPRPYWYR